MASLPSTICLNMIVKNEAHIIIQTLDNISSYFNFSYWVIGDNGSTDGTQKLIKDYFKKKNIKGELYEDKWVDFGFKGGSEPGVLNFTQLLQKEEGGDVYTISVTLNDKENNIATNKAIDLVSRLISLLENNKLIRVDNE